MIDDFFRPESISDALELKERFKEEAIFFAGGTEINSTELDSKIQKAISLELLNLKTIDKNDKEVTIGSAVTMQELLNSPIVPPPLKTAAGFMTNRNIRNMATIGGNIALNKSCSNLIPVLISLGAELTIFNPDIAQVPLYNYVENNLNHLISCIKVPINNYRQIGLKRFTRSANDIAVLNTAVSFFTDGEKIKDIRAALGGVSAHVIRLKNLEVKLENNILPSKDKIEEIVEDGISPIDDLRGSAEFKKYLAGVLVSDCFHAAFKSKKEIP